MRRGGDAGRPVHVEPDVVLAAQDTFARVQPHPDANGCAGSPVVGCEPPLGGDRRSGRIEAHATLILEAVARTPDLTLAELRSVLVTSGVAVGMTTLWRFLDRHRITLKKRPRTQPSRAAPMGIVGIQPSRKPDISRRSARGHASRIVSKVAPISCRMISGTVAAGPKSTA